jgi:hypothetical protein
VIRVTKNRGMYFTTTGIIFLAIIVNTFGSGPYQTSDAFRTYMVSLIFMGILYVSAKLTTFVFVNARKIIYVGFGKKYTKMRYRPDD